MTINTENKVSFDFLITKADFGNELGNRKAINVIDLYDALGLDKKSRARWIRRNITETDMWLEGQDYVIVDEEYGKHKTRETIMCRIPMAKMLCMKADTPNAILVKNYFVEQETQVWALQNNRADLLNQDTITSLVKQATEKAVAEAVSQALKIERQNTQQIENFMTVKIKLLDEQTRAGLVRMVREVVRNNPLYTYEDVWNMAYRRLMSIRNVGWKQEFWASKNKLDFLSTKDPKYLRDLREILLDLRY